jgi:hypothetical protein
VIFNLKGEIPKDSVIINLVIGTMLMEAGTYLIKSWTILPNGVSDCNVVNDTAAVTYTN